MSALGRHFKVLAVNAERTLSEYAAGKYKFMKTGPYDWESHDFSSVPKACSLFFDMLTPNDGQPGKPPGTMTATTSIEIYSSVGSRRGDDERHGVHADLISDALDMLIDLRRMKDENGDSVIIGLRNLGILPVTFAGGRGRPQGVIANIELTY